MASVVPPPQAAPPPTRQPLALDASNATVLAPNQSVSGTLAAGGQRLFKVWANRSMVSPELLTVTLEASGGAFPNGGAAVIDPDEILIDEVFTTYAGQIVVARVIVP